MTTMIDRFFGIPQHVVRAGTWKQLKPGEVGLYVCLLHQSERYSSRVIKLTDKQVHELVGVAPRTLSNARKKLQELGLIQYQSGIGNRYTYTLCDPTTKRPYPGSPKSKVIYPKGSNQKHQTQTASATEPEVAAPLMLRKPYLPGQDEQLEQGISWDELSQSSKRC